MSVQSHTELLGTGMSHGETRGSAVQGGKGEGLSLVCCQPEFLFLLPVF